MKSTYPTYREAARQPAHRSLFREALARRARPAGDADPVHEYLIDQANLRGFHGAYSGRADLGTLDAALTLEEIIVGLLQPHAPAEGRVLKLVVRMLQSGQVDPDRLLFLARREIATGVLAWLVDLVPAAERNEHLERLGAMLRRHPPRHARPPNVRYDPRRLVRRPGLR